MFFSNLGWFYYERISNSNQYNYGKSKYKSKWEKVTEEIMKWWICIVLALSLAPYRGDLRDLWSSGEIVKK